MANTWDKISQTHRTILFEQFTHPNDAFTSNLYDLLDTFDDEKLDKSITEKLEVHSFNEFMEKFLPTVYEYATAESEDGQNLFFHYTTDPVLAKEYPDHREVKLTQEAYYEMLVDMYTQKGDSGLANINFNDEKIREILTPKSEIQDFYDKRRQLPLLLEQYEECLKNNENPTPVIKRIKQIRREALEKTKKVSSMIVIAHDDTQREIKLIDAKINPPGTRKGTDNEQLSLIKGRVIFGEDGQIKLIESSTSSSDDPKNDSPGDPQGKRLEKIAASMEGDLKKYAADSGKYTHALIISAYTGVDIRVTTPFDKMSRTELVEYRETLVNKKNFLENCYKQMKESLIETLSDVVQKILSVKIFFDHATVKGTESAALPKAGLIIANCTANKLIGSKVKDKFSERMKHYGTKESGDKKIWFAILPNVTDNNSGIDDSPDKVQSPYDDDIDDEDDEIISADSVDFNAAKSLLKIMDESKITTVFNFTPTEETTFSGITVDAITKIQDKFSEMNNEHAVCALPNFTIMKSGVVPVSDEPNAPKIKVPAIYINASYVAAGLLVAVQQPDFWISRGFKNEVNFLTKNACVRIDLESNTVTQKLLTKFNRERSIEWSRDVIDALTKKRFGFVFSGDRKSNTENGNYITNTYILNARTLGKTSNGEYKPLFAVLMKDFVSTYLNSFGTPITTESSDKFFKDVSEWNRQSKEYNTNIINLFLREGESIVRPDLNGSKCIIKLQIGSKLIDMSFDLEVGD